MIRKNLNLSGINMYRFLKNVLVAEKDFSDCSPS